MLTKREKDKSNEGFINWPFMSVHTWGEDPFGLWKILIIANVFYFIFYIIFYILFLIIFYILRLKIIKMKIWVFYLILN